MQYPVDTVALDEILESTILRAKGASVRVRPPPSVSLGSAPIAPPTSHPDAPLSSHAPFEFLDDDDVVPDFGSIADDDDEVIPLPAEDLVEIEEVTTVPPPRQALRKRAP